MGKKERLIKEKIGEVVSNKMNKTVVVAINTKKQDASYGKFVKHRKKFFAHDENNECQIGDTVLINETRPMSKNKSWKVKQILTKAVIVEEIGE